MKRKLMWVALPLVLATSIGGMKLRADSLAATERVREVREFLSKYPVQITIGNRRSKKFKLVESKLSKAELKPYIESFQVLSNRTKAKGQMVDMSGDRSVQ